MACASSIPATVPKLFAKWRGSDLTTRRSKAMDGQNACPPSLAESKFVEGIAQGRRHKILNEVAD